MMKRLWLAAALLAAAAVPADTQTAVINPTGLIFFCPDHAQDTDHEVDIVRASDGVVVQTLLVGDPAADANGDVTVDVNVMPVAFGDYFFRARAVAGAFKSADSTPSPTWWRRAGPPSNLRVRG